MNDSTENWRVIEPFPQYEISDLGRVRRRTRSLSNPRWPAGFILRQAEMKNRPHYPIVSLFDRVNSKYKTLLVHRLVCLAFHGPCPGSEYEVAHNNGDAKDCKASNLRWATRSENQKDQRLHGTRRLGSRVHNARLDERAVIEIRARLQSGERCVDIARSFQIAKSAISSIGKRKSWTHI